MKLHLKNLGILHHVDLEIGDLTVICGKNNSGKTYATYALYGLLKSWMRLTNGLLPRESLNELLQTGTASIDLQLHLSAKWQSILDGIGKRYHHFLPSVLAADASRFTETQIKLDLPKPNLHKDEEIKGLVGSEEQKEAPLLSYHKPAGSTVMQFTFLRRDRLHLPDIAIESLATSVLQDHFLRP